jgi:hypothetical protein
MKRVHIPRSLATAPRLTLWVPVLMAFWLSMIWLAALALLT